MWLLAFILLMSSAKSHSSSLAPTLLQTESPSFVQNRTIPTKTFFDLRGYRSSDSEEVSLSNMTFVAVLGALTFLSICAMTGIYCVCCVEERPRDASSTRAMREPLTPTTRRLSNIWIRTPNDMESAALPQDFSPRESSWETIPNDADGEKTRKVGRKLSNHGLYLKDLPKTLSVDRIVDYPKRMKEAEYSDNAPPVLTELARRYTSSQNNSTLCTSVRSVGGSALSIVESEENLSPQNQA